MAFARSRKISADDREIHCFSGNPDCAAFYAWILQRLNEVVSVWQPPASKLTHGQRGNLGELISYLVASHDGLDGEGYTAVLAGALTPMQIGTYPGIDVIILYLAPDGDSDSDRLYLMEVKTTGRVHLRYADALISDYKKLLDSNAPSTTLASRMSALKAKLKLENKFSTALLDRVDDLYRPDPAHCTRITLIPTLVHDRNHGDPTVTLNHVAQEIEFLGWLQDSVQPWSIAIARLNSCLVHLAKRIAFTP